MSVLQDRLEANAKRYIAKKERLIRIKTLIDSGYSVSEIAKTLEMPEAWVKVVIKLINQEEQNGNV